MLAVPIKQPVFSPPNFGADAPRLLLPQAKPNGVAGAKPPKKILNLAVSSRAASYLQGPGTISTRYHNTPR